MNIQLTEKLVDQYLYVNQSYVNKNIIIEDIVQILNDSNFNLFNKKQKINQLAKKIDLVLMIYINIRSKHLHKIKEELTIHFNKSFSNLSAN